MVKVLLNDKFNKENLYFYFQEAYSMENRIYNFNPGPAMQPLEVLQEAQAEFLNFAKSGMSII